MFNFILIFLFTNILVCKKTSCVDFLTEFEQTNAKIKDLKQQLLQLQEQQKRIITDDEPSPKRPKYTCIESGPIDFKNSMHRGMCMKECKSFEELKHHLREQHNFSDSTLHTHTCPGCNTKFTWLTEAETHRKSCVDLTLLKKQQEQKGKLETFEAESTNHQNKLSLLDPSLPPPPTDPLKADAPCIMHREKYQLGIGSHTNTTIHCIECLILQAENNPECIERKDLSKLLKKTPFTTDGCIKQKAKELKAQKVGNILGWIIE